MNKKISLDVLKIILTPWEMKNVTGGSGGSGYPTCDGKCDGVSYSGKCAYSCAEIHECYSRPFAGTNCFPSNCTC